MQNPDIFKEFISDFDKAQYHAKAADFPKDAGYYQAYIHIGFFLGFLAELNLLAADKSSKKKVKQFLSREIRAGELCKFFGGTLSPFDLSEEGKVFTFYYYNDPAEHEDVVGLSENSYLREYEEVLAKEIKDAGNAYLIEDSWDNYAKVKDRIQQRYEEWKNAGSPRPRYRDFKSLSESDRLKVETYIKNKLAIGLLSKTYPEVKIDARSFKSYVIEIGGAEAKAFRTKFHSLEDEIRSYLKKFTDKSVWFEMK